MPYRVFRVPSRGCEYSEQLLNDFLGNHRVLRVTEEFVSDGENSFWCFCVDYLEQGAEGFRLRFRWGDIERLVPADVCRYYGVH